MHEGQSKSPLTGNLTWNPSLSRLGPSLLKRWWRSRVDLAWMNLRCHFRLAIEAGADPYDVSLKSLSSTKRYGGTATKTPQEKKVGHWSWKWPLEKVSLHVHFHPCFTMPCQTVEIRHRPAQAPCSCDHGPDFIFAPLPFGRLHSSYSTHFKLNHEGRISTG